MSEIDLEKIRKLRAALRKQLPDLDTGCKISQETLSAAMALLGEVITIRILISKPESPMVPLMKDVCEALSREAARILKAHIPDAIVTSFFREPGEQP